MVMLRERFIKRGTSDLSQKLELSANNGYTLSNKEYRMKKSAAIAAILSS
jgi:hypothetical protein